MAQSTTVSSAFVGTVAGQIFIQAFKAADTINKGLITMLPNIIGPNGYLPKVTHSQALTEYSCGFTPNGTVGYTDKAIPVKKYEIKDEFCKNDFAQTFQAQALGLFGAKEEIPSTIQDAILLAMVRNLGAVIDTEIWQGAGTTGHFSGLLAQLVADSEVIDVTGATVTSANVLAEVAKVYNAIPDILDMESPNMVIAVSTNVAKAYKQAIAAAYTGYFNQGDIPLDYLGIRMESIKGLPANNMVAYEIPNVGFLTGLESDLNNVRIFDTDATLGDGRIRTEMVFTAGVGYAFGGEIVYYRP